MSKYIWIKNHFLLNELKIRIILLSIPINNNIRILFTKFPASLIVVSKSRLK